MAKLPKQLLIKTLLEDGVITDTPRPYLGMSQLGAPCKRSLWYSFRTCYTRTFTPRQMRIFKRGDLEEPRILKDLESIGIAVVSTQATLVGYAGHCRGHTDGIVRNVPGYEGQDVLLEIKTAKDSSFKKYPKQGCKKTNRQYYFQVQVYMHYNSLALCLFIVTNKDTEERYYEIIRPDEDAIQDALNTAEEVIATDTPPGKIGQPDWWECKFCDAYDVCHFDAKIYACCRNCRFGEVRAEGKWHCLKFEKELSVEEQTKLRDETCYHEIETLSE